MIWVIVAVVAPLILAAIAVVFRYGGLSQAVRDMREDFDRRLSRIEAILDNRNPKGDRE